MQSTTKTERKLIGFLTDDQNGSGRNIVTQADEAVVYWNENVTLRRFMIASSIVLLWIGCDLGLHSLAHQESLESDVRREIEGFIGFPISQNLVEWLPGDSWRLQHRNGHFFTITSG